MYKDDAIIFVNEVINRFARSIELLYEKELETAPEISIDDDNESEIIAKLTKQLLVNKIVNNLLRNLNVLRKEQTMEIKENDLFK